MEDIIIFGASLAGKGSYFFLKNHYNIKYFCDNNKDIIGQEIYEILIISPENLKNLTFDRIVIASQYFEEILNQLLNLNLNKPISIFNINLSEIGTNFNMNNLATYLSGANFHSGLKIKYDEISLNYDSRINTIRNIIENLNIVHLGCTDHLSLINHKIKSNNWLHGIVSQAAKKCIGIDNNEKAVNYLLNSGYLNIIFGDILNDTIDEINNINWDYLLMPEVLEHINNPTNFLITLRSKFSNFDRILITVPNALSEANFDYAKQNIENINTDHRYWFTPYTITKILFEAGYDVEQLIMCGMSQKECKYHQSLMMPNIVVIAKF